MDPAALAREGPVAILLAGIVALFLAFIRGDIVPGWIFRAMEARALKAETQAERNTDALEKVADTVKAALDRRGPAGG